MVFRELELPGAYLVELEPVEDERGFNARAFCRQEFDARGLVSDFVQVNVLYNRARGTVRGMHWQAPPAAEGKLFRCVSGAVYDVIADLRPDSPTYERWTSVTLSAEARNMLYVPPCFAQGFQTLADDTELIYQVSAYYTPELGRGFRPDDPRFGIEWPLPATVMSGKDRSWPDYDDQPPALVAPEEVLP
jgi:dTDP-4-dehydrorhamnose 3,5-epimerase